MKRVLDVLRVHGPSSQASIARRAELSPATVNNIVRALRDEGTAELRPVNGREALVHLVSRRGVIVTVEVSDRGVRGVAFDFSEGVRHDEGEVSRSNPKATLELIQALALEAGSRLDELTGVAVAMQAPIDRTTGAVASWVNGRLPGWRDTALQPLFDRALRVPVVIDNDANFAALGEWTWGVGRGVDDFLYVTASRGVGGGLMTDGRMYRGGTGMAGDLGHLVLEPSGEVCYCGSRGCLTTLISERAILGSLRAADAPKKSLDEVIASATAGDPACQRVLAESGRYLGRALANVAKVAGPSVIGIGGVLGRSGPQFTDGLQSAMEISNLRAVSPSTRFRIGRLGPDAAIFGGAAAVLTATGQGVSEPPSWMMTPIPRAS